MNQLVERSVPVIAVDGAHREPMIPAPGNPGRLTALRDLTTREDVTLLIPTLSQELPELAAGRSVFAPDVDVVLASAGAVAIAHDRLFTARHLRDRGVPIPQFGSGHEFTSPQEALTLLGAPLVIRPRMVSGGNHTHHVYATHDVDWDQVSSGVVLRRHAPGAAYTVLLYRPRANSDIKPAIVTLARDTDAPDNSHTSLDRLRRGQVMDVERLALAAVRALGLVGPASVDIRRTADGQPLVIDVTARFTEHCRLAPELLSRVWAEAGHRTSTNAPPQRPTLPWPTSHAQAAHPRTPAHSQVKEMT